MAAAARLWRASGALLCVLWAVLLAGCWGELVDAWRRGRVVVVGAGLAGAAAAHDLRAAGYAVDVLEARGRVGGRIFTNTELGFPIELGAAFAHRPGNNPIVPLLREHNVTHVAYDFARGVYFDRDGTRFTEAEHRWGKVHFDRLIYEDVQDAIEAGERTSGPLWDEALWSTLSGMDESYHALPARLRRLIDVFCYQYIVQELQADLSDVSAKEFDPVWAGTVLPHPEYPLYQPHDEVLYPYDSRPRGAPGRGGDGEESTTAAAAATLGGATGGRCGASTPSAACGGGGDGGNGGVRSVYPGSDRFIASGYVGLVRGLLTGVPVRLATTVTRVRYVDHTPSLLSLDEVLQDPRGMFAPGAPLAPLRDSVYTVAAVLEEVVGGGLRWWAARVGGARDVLGRGGALVALECNTTAAAAAVGGSRDTDSAASPRPVTHTARRAVLSLPIGVLKTRRVGFDPALPYSLQDAVADLGVSPALKVAMCWAEADMFWGNETYHYFHAYPHDPPAGGGGETGQFGRGQFVEAVNLWTLAQRPCLLFEVETDFARGLAQLPLAAKVERLMRAVRALYPTAVPPTRGAVESDFTSPYSDGGYVHFGVDTGAEHVEEFTYPVSRRLYWAGEHTVREHYGNTHGAYVSGQRAAAQIIAADAQALGALSLLTLTTAAAAAAAALLWVR